MVFKPKPHPTAIYESLVESLRGSAVKVVANDEFLPALQECAACIVEATTLALIPALMGIPLFYATYDQLSDLRFGAVLTSYPRGFVLRDLAAVSQMLRTAAETVDPHEVERWITLNAGPVPIADMPDRVADVVADIIPDCGSR
jgi:hypothetical protein